MLFINDQHFHNINYVNLGWNFLKCLCKYYKIAHVMTAINKLNCFAICGWNYGNSYVTHKDIMSNQY